MSKTIYSDKIKVNCPLVHDENGYYHLVYKIVNTVNGKIYIGKHSTKDPYDNYMGSGKSIHVAIKKYGIEHFIKEILFCFDKEDNAFLKEAEIVNLEFIDRNDTYNMVVGGNKCAGCWSGKNNPMYGKKHTQEARNKMSKILKEKMKGEGNSFYGRKHTKDSRIKISQNHADVSGEKNPFYGKKHTQALIDRLSEINSGAKHPNAKAILKIDVSGNIITEYGCKKDCREQEGLSRKILDKLINKHILYNGFYFEFKSKN